MTVDYAAIALEVAAALEEVNQGVIVLHRTTLGTPPNEYTPGEPTTTSYTLMGTAKGVSKEYIDGTTILATDIELLLSTQGRDEAGALVSISPDFVTDTLTVDGKAVTPVRDLSVPAAGVKVVLKLIVRG